MNHVKQVDLREGDCLEVMRTLRDDSIDSCVTDPPYDLTANKKGGSGAASLNEDSPAGRSRIGTGGGFMGKAWDATGIAFDPATWREVLRVLRPGGHLLAFGGTRTYHRMACAIEDAGFEIRDSIHWHYGTGFPKSLNLGDGFGTALKPGHEPIILARKPVDGTTTQNYADWGTGGLNVDGCRLDGAPDPAAWTAQRTVDDADGRLGQRAANVAAMNAGLIAPPSGRWPPNVLFSHAEDCAETCGESCPVAELDRQSGVKTSGDVTKQYSATLETSVALGAKKRHLSPDSVYADTGGASRFFPVFRYEAKPPRSEREEGTAELPARAGHEAVEREEGSAGVANPRAGAGRTAKEVRNFHPTVKPMELMRWLVRLVTPLNGIVLEPFLGSGTTGVACVKEGLRIVGIEREAEYMTIARARVAHAQKTSVMP